MRCEEIMKKAVECVRPDEPVRSAAERMRDDNMGFLPVCGADKKVIGTVTDRDLTIRVLAEGKPATTSVREVMTREVVSCSPDDDVQHAVELLAKHKKSRIMCIDDEGRLVGVISLSDIAQVVRGEEAGQTLRYVTQRETVRH